ncbi:MAG: cellulase family glycosylhydrolase, partial [Lachnospiraceae bacterium]|nr:cellulase family glycosylhydrolase [Lachnospiraceae bacterium]
PADDAPASSNSASGDPASEGASHEYPPAKAPAQSPEPSASPVPPSPAPSGEAGPYAAYPSISGALQVSGTQLTNKDGHAVQLKGISTHGLSWFPEYVNKECFRQLREEWNVNVIRLAMYTAEYGGYCSGGDQEALKELIRNGVEYASELDMYVILDWHILSDGNPNTYLDQARDFFQEMSQDYASRNNVLYEICNEPNGSTSWSDIKAYAEEIIPVIRNNDEDGIIIVGTPNWSQYVDQAAADPISGYDNIMYSLHFYAATHKDSLRKAMTDAIDAGLPIFVSEYGICDASGNGSIDENQARKWIDVMNQYGISYVAWNLSNKSETSAILSAGCNKTSGFTEDDLSSSGRWLFAMLTGEDTPDSSLEQSALSPARTSKPSGQTPAPSPAQTDNPPENTKVPLLPEGAGCPVSFTAKLINSWESEGLSYYQYELTLQNTSGTDCSNWAVDVPFSEAFTLSDCWNGEYTVSGQTLHITNKDYNGSIPSGGSVNNIGFIISGGKALAISQ